MGKYKTPKHLISGDYVGIVSPAGKIDPFIIKKAAELLKDKGFGVVIGAHACNAHHMFAGTIAERAEDFQKMLDDRKIKAILCSRGGYGSIHTIQKLNFSSFLKNPKWIVGYSDITIFHSFLNTRFQIKTIHGAMPVKYMVNGKVSKDFDGLITVLSGEKPIYQIQPHVLNKEGVASGILTGGNLSVLLSLFNTRYSPDFDGKVLFIEEVGEHLYRLDRMMATLKLSGKLKKLKGLIVGSISGIPDDSPPFGKNAEEIIRNYIEDYDYPMCFNFPAGHADENLPLIMGSTVELIVENDKTSLKFLN